MLKTQIIAPPILNQALNLKVNLHKPKGTQRLTTRDLIASFKSGDGIKKSYTAIGLMSGTSMDGIDVSLIKSDGIKIISLGQNKYYPYNSKIKNSLAKLIDNKILSLLEIKKIELEITNKHIEAVQDFLIKNKIDKKNVDVVGFHGQTILHNPEQKITWQIGNAQMLASEIGVGVVADFRTKDLVFEGQGAPLVPAYHLALFKDYKISNQTNYNIK